MTQKMLSNFAFVAFAIFACLSTFANGQQYAANAVNICENVASNIFVTDPTNCTNYYLCLNGQPILQACESGLYFNEDTQSCIVSNTGCITCNPNTLTIYALKRTCNKYVMCFAGVPVLRQCGDDLQIGNDGLCNVATKVDCVANQCAIQSNPDDILFIPSFASCNYYYICMNGVTVNRSCAVGLQFNPAGNYCDLASKVNCQIKIPKATRNSATYTHTEPQIVDIGCPQTGTLFYPHSNTNQYYVCVNGKGAIFTCAEGLFYDSKMQECRQLKNILAQQ